MSVVQLSRDLARETEELNQMQEWVAAVSADSLAATRVRVSWDIGSAVSGYAPLARLVAAEVSANLPALLAKVVAEQTARTKAKRRELRQALAAITDE